MKNVLVKIEYEGTRYKGWQVQPEVTTVEETLKMILRQVCRCDVKIKTCSRTDSGVHARGQVVNVFIPDSVSLNKLFFSLNSMLPGDISVVDMVETPDDFLARHQNQGKRYIYQIVNSPIAKALSKELYWWIKKPLDLVKMRQACRLFSGTHNFSAFRGKGCQQENTVKTIRDIQVAWRTEGLFTYLEIPIEGSGFLKNMVRIMVGTLVEIGRGRFEEDTICQALESGSRGKAGLTAPAKGLILDRIFFDPDPFEERRLETWNLP